VTEGESVLLADVTTKVGSGSTPRGGEASYKSKGVPLIRSMNVHFDGFRREGLAFLDDDQARALKNVEVRAGDVLLNITGASIGRVTVAPDTMDGARVNQHVCIIRPDARLDSSYLRWYLASPSKQHLINGIESGATRQALTKEKILGFHVPLPPLDVQREVVAELEKQFSRLDEAVANLKRVKANLKRYKAAVLKAAVEGRLVPTEAELARREGRSYEPGAQLLQRILVERRGQCKRKVEYHEPATLEARDQPELPEGWAWATVEQVSCLIEYGTSAKTSEEHTGIPVLRMGNIVEGELAVEDLKYLPTEHEEFPKLLLEPGDLLFNRTNSPELVGKTAVFGGVPKVCSFASYLIRVRVVQGCMPGLLAAYINSPRGRGWVKSVATQQVGQANVNGTKLQALGVPLPPESEQRRILAEVERRLSFARQVEAAVNSNVERANRLRRATLARAFSNL